MHYLDRQYLLQDLINGNTFLQNSVSLEAEVFLLYLFPLNYLILTILQ